MQPAGQTEPTVISPARAAEDPAIEALLIAPLVGQVPSPSLWVSGNIGLGAAVGYAAAVSAVVCLPLVSALAMTLVMAWVAHHLIEHPLRRYGRGLSQRLARSQAVQTVG